MNSPTPTYVLRSVEDSPECAVVDCHEQVCDPGVICGKHGDQIICPACFSPCKPYAYQRDWHEKPRPACDKCDAVFPCGWVDPRYAVDP